MNRYVTFQPDYQRSKSIFAEVIASSIDSLINLAQVSRKFERSTKSKLLGLPPIAVLVIRVYVKALVLHVCVTLRGWLDKFYNSATYIWRASDFLLVAKLMSGR